MTPRTHQRILAALSLGALALAALAGVLVGVWLVR